MIKDVVQVFRYNSLAFEIMCHPRSGISGRYRKEFKIMVDVQNMMVPVVPNYIPGTPTMVPQWLMYEFESWTILNHVKFSAESNRLIQEEKAATSAATSSA